MKRLLIAPEITDELVQKGSLFSAISERLKKTKMESKRSNAMFFIKMFGIWTRTGDQTLEYVLSPFS